ncbi:hypothetical protein C0Q70_05935 [Pomacea canaliculata]|uniref:Uncharacterized protein n=1 Tax=Pomacea canaliculata TaxID=400727 RepID=A0A2T7PMJ3_POMCA|nr:hypothetical protein C0Q70_05935 [Pomacea canaliculata]
MFEASVPLAWVHVLNASADGGVSYYLHRVRCPPTEFRSPRQKLRPPRVLVLQGHQSHRLRGDETPSSPLEGSRRNIYRHPPAKKRLSFR